MGAALGAADGHCDGLLVNGSLPGASLRLQLGMPLEISVGDSLGCMGGRWDLQTPSRKEWRSVLESALHCDGLLDRSLLGASLRLWLGMPLGTSVSDSLGCIDARRLAGAAARHAAWNIYGRLARLHRLPQAGICRYHHGRHGARCLSGTCAGRCLLSSNENDRD